ncbi:hypothetical protein RRG08_026196 [Elysia crispata]|uniref:Uncharacterized protein n=1 Tax=Elysia crispata TaxID=231223 RepID=A0AAE0ZAG1_9GAST|nr:hypothetical protein RRG08_026196 [Elysia crispata]
MGISSKGSGRMTHADFNIGQKKELAASGGGTRKTNANFCIEELIRARLDLQEKNVSLLARALTLWGEQSRDVERAVGLLDTRRGEQSWSSWTLAVMQLQHQSANNDTR